MGNKVVKNVRTVGSTKVDKAVGTPLMVTLTLPIAEVRPNPIGSKAEIIIKLTTV